LNGLATLDGYLRNPWAAPYAVSALVLAFLAFRAWRGGTAVERAWARFLVAAALAQLFVALSGSAKLEQVSLWWLRLALAAGALVGPLALESAVLIVEWVGGLRLLRLSLLLAAAALAVLTPTTDWVITTPVRSQYGWIGTAGPLFGAHCLVTSASLLPSLALFIVHLRRSQNTQARRRLSYVLVGYGIGCFAAFDLLPFFGIEVTPSSYLPIVFCGSVVTHAIRQPRLADLPTVAARSLAWAALSALVFVPLFGLLWVSRNWGGWTNPLVASLAIYGLFLLLRWYLFAVQPRIDHLFQRRMHDLDAAAARFGERVAVLHTVPDLARAIAHVLEETLYARLGAFAVAPVEGEEVDQGGAAWKVVASAWGSVPPPETSDPLLERLREEPHVLTREALAQGAVARERPHAERMFARYRADVLLVLVARPSAQTPSPLMSLEEAIAQTRGGRVLGIIAVSPPAGERPFTELELDFLDRVRTHSAAALLQARLYDRLFGLKAQLEEKVVARTNELARAAQSIESTQRELVEQEKMSLLGLLVSGVAQELTTAVERAHASVPELIRHLAALQVALDLCRDAAGEAAQAELVAREKAVRLDYVRRDLGALVDAIAEGARRATAIAQDLGRFARADAAQRQQADLHAGIESTLNLLRHELGGGRVTVERDFDREIPPLECYPGPLNQVFMNLLLNAAQAIEESGTIQIRTRRVDEERIEVAVRDTGKGIPREHLTRIFEPFFTTKGQGGRSGSGLGLAISYGIVQRHGGRILVESELGKGTEFRVLLPIRAPSIRITLPLPS
jgi:two-component system NtrC family sensor kinase